MRCKNKTRFGELCNYCAFVVQLLGDYCAIIMPLSQTIKHKNYEMKYWGINESNVSEFQSLRKLPGKYSIEIVNSG